MISAPARRLLRAIARANGVATGYLDYRGKPMPAKPEAVARLIDAVRGAALIGDNFSAVHLRQVLAILRAERDAAGLPAVVVAWDGVFPAVWVAQEGDEIPVTLTSEEGEPATHVQAGGARGAKGRVRLTWPEQVPFGYYTLTVGGKTSFLISAPRKVAANEPRSWGVFAPTYALRSARDQGIGGYRELGEAARFVRAQGGAFLGTLPLLPVFYEGEKPNPSPYSPVSRLFWNEIFLDLSDLPGEVKPEIDLDDLFASSRQEPLVDYQEIYAVKKRVLQKAADAFFAAQPEGDAEYRAYAAATPLLVAYAEFHAARGPYEEREAVIRFHKYAQYACHRQLSQVRDAAHAELYLDYPVGVHPDGFDAAQFKDLFVPGYNVGAPPDGMFTSGQDWGFQALNPHKLVEDRFQYFRAALHHYFAYARMLRLDHVMGLFRLYCVPQGDGAHNGGYLRYPFEALLAILCLEAQRHDGVLIGEDLGTVPDAVEHGMTAHGLHRMWILYFQLNELPARSFGSIEADVIAGLNTHDMFPFAAFLKGDDINELERLGLMDAKNARTTRRGREKTLRKWRAEAKPLLTALEGMAASPARYVMVGMEDLWGETEPQNIPGTVEQYPNWRRKFAVPVDDWDSRPDVWEALAVLNDHRRVAAEEKIA